MSATITEIQATADAHVVGAEQVQAVRDILDAARRAKLRRDYDVADELWQAINDICQAVGISPEHPELAAARRDIEDSAAALIEAVQNRDYEGAGAQWDAVSARMPKVRELSGSTDLPKTVVDALRAYNEDRRRRTVRITPKLKSLPEYCFSSRTLDLSAPESQVWLTDDEQFHKALAAVLELIPAYRERGHHEDFDKALARLDRAARRVERERPGGRSDVVVEVILPHRHSS